MDASGLSTSGTHTIRGSPLGSVVRGGPGNVNFAGGIGDDTFVFGSGMSRVMGGGGNDSFILVKGGIAAGDQIIDFHLNLSDGGEHDTLQLLGFSAAARLDLVSSSVSGTGAMQPTAWWMATTSRRTADPGRRQQRPGSAASTTSSAELLCPGHMRVRQAACPDAAAARHVVV